MVYKPEDKGKDLAKVLKPTPQITPESIIKTKQSIALLQGMVKDLLIRGTDYGRIPGTPQDSLWDPGASNIIGAFNCFPGERRILKFEDNAEKIVVCVEVPIISRETGMVATTGIGAASTLELKYKYRWVPNPLEFGYNEESMKTLKTKTEGNKILFRIPNREHSELLNTIVKMSSKRAEVDAAESLPGVASVLRQIFSRQRSTADKGTVWDQFWGEANRLGMDENEVHQKLGVASMKDWFSSGKSLKQALDILRGRQEYGNKPKRDSGSIKTFGDLYPACLEDFGLNREGVWKELNVNSQEEITDTPGECYEKIASVR